MIRPSKFEVNQEPAPQPQGPRRLVESGPAQQQPTGVAAAQNGGSAKASREPVAAGVAAAVASGKVGRNDPCPCGSGKKYKRCHGR